MLNNLNRVIKILLENEPELIFCGSVALNMLGLINREPNDIDLVTSINKDWSNSKLLGKINDDRRLLKNYHNNTRSFYINNVKIEIFEIDNLNFDIIYYKINNKLYNVRVQKLSDILDAKKNFGGKKHNKDLKNIQSEN